LEVYDDVRPLLFRGLKHQRSDVRRAATSKQIPSLVGLARRMCIF
jgi:hypothetical protein